MAAKWSHLPRLPVPNDTNTSHPEQAVMRGAGIRIKERGCYAHWWLTKPNR